LLLSVEGELTVDRRAAHPATETGAELLPRILAERRTRWEADLRAKGKDPAKARYEQPVEPDAAGLAEIPDGWCWATIACLLREPMSNGISIKGSDIPPGTRALRLSAMSDMGFDYDDHRYIAIDDHTAVVLAIRAGDFYVARGNGSLHLVGRGTLAQEPPARVVFPDTMIRLRVGNLGRFVSVVWPSSHMRYQIEQTARTTAGIYKISQHDIERFAVPLPPEDEQRQIVAEVERRLSVVTALAVCRRERKSVEGGAPFCGLW